MKKLLIPLFALTLITMMSCSSSYKRPESISSKMARYQAKSEERNSVPKLATVEIKFSSKYRKSKGRVPASADGGTSFDKTTPYSNKRLYFLTLLGQYNKLKKYTQSETPAVEICPNFHTSTTAHRQQYGKIKITKTDPSVFNYNKNKLASNAYVAIFPELMLPINVSDVHPRVIDLYKQEGGKSLKRLLTKALDVHISKTFSEISELCEHGTSQNYYIFENLITYIKRTPSFKASTNGMETLLKTTLFSNMMLIESLEDKSSGRSRSIASVNSDYYSNAVIDRLKVQWAREYFNTIKMMRKRE